MNHLGGSGPSGDPITFMPDIWGYVCLKYGIHSIIDIGCALGFNSRWLFNRGYDVVGVEGFPEYVAGNKLPKDRVISHDYAKGPYLPPRRFDLGICTEFVEHVEARFASNFLATFQSCKFILMTHALPGQGGFHHVNEQDSTYWANRMASENFRILQDDSDLFRSTFQPHERYGRNTLTLFEHE